MSKLLKSVAPVVLAVFCSVCIVGPAWGEVQLTPPRISAPDYVDAAKSFQIKIVFDKDVYSAGKYSFRVSFPEQFNKGIISFQITNESYELTATAPTQEGKSVIRFLLEEEGITLWISTAEVSVVNKATQGINVGNILFNLIMIPFQAVYEVLVGIFLPVGSYRGNSL
jgi:hypothetical protein